MNYKTAIFRKIDSCFRRNDSGQKINSSFYGDEGRQKIDSSVIARNEVTKQSQASRFFSIPERKTNLLFIILILILITSFLTSASAQDIYMTNIWYKKLPNYTHLTIKSSGEISEYEVSYLEEPDRIVIDVKNAIYSIDDLSKNILFLNMGSTKQVRCGQLENIPIPITRFVVDLFQRADYEVKLSADKRLLFIDVYDYVEFRAPEEQIFTVTPVKSEAVKIEKEEAPKISLLDTYGEPINMKIFEEDVVNVIRGLSELTGIDIMIDDSVTGQLTLNLSNKTFREAIGLILMNKGLDFTEVSGTLVIAAKEIIAGYGKPITKIFELKNATAEGAKLILDGNKKEGSKIIIVADARMNNLIVTGTNEEIEAIEGIIRNIDDELLTKTFKIDNAIGKEEIEAIKNMLSIIVPGEGRVNTDSRQSEIIVKGTEEELVNVETMIAGLDKRAPQIMMEAKIIEIILDDEKDLGIKWTSGGNEGQISIGEITLGGSFERSGLIEATLKALQSEAKTNILSNPKVLTLDGKEGYMKSTTDIPIIEEKESEGVVIKTVTWKPVGIELTITPRLSADEFITMNVVTSVKSLGTEFIQGYPVINDRTETAIIRTKLGVTTVIGGLISSEDIKTITKIPILGSIPIFGELFKFTRTTNKKSEIIILITTHLLDY
jgi:type II secretory pathway component GspD/PulD (secretin)